MFTQIFQFRANLKRAATLLENDYDEKYNWCDYPMIQSYHQKETETQIPMKLSIFWSRDSLKTHIRNEFNNLNHLFDEPYHHNNYNKKIKSIQKKKTMMTERATDRK